MTNTELNKPEEQIFEKEAVKLLLEDDLKSKYAILLAEKHRVTRMDKRYISLPLVLKAAAVIVLVCGSFLIFNALGTNGNRQLALNLAKETYVLGNQDVMRKDNTLSDQTRLQANAAFVNKDYNEAINLFEKLKALHYANDVDLFYLAVSYLKSDYARPEKALVLLNNYTATDSLYNEVEWFKALAYVAVGKETEAKKLLLNIIAHNKYKVTEAKILLQKLKIETLS